MEFKHKSPVLNKDIRQAIYNGDVFILPASTASLEMIEVIRNILTVTFDSIPNLEKIHEIKSSNDIYNSIQLVREKIQSQEFSNSHIIKIASEFSWDVDDTLYDLIRLRCSSHNGHKNELANNAYTVHRDTWYSNPECQVNYWIPIFDVQEEQTFNFFPDYFDKSIENNSCKFDYDIWSSEIGFQSKSKSTNPIFPTSLVHLDDKNRKSFSCKAGDIVVFSNSHLHQTCFNDTGLSRFSIDFRLVSINDREKNIGAPNVDNKSKGDASKYYSRLRYTI